MAIVDIDSTWLTNNGGPNGPYILSSGNCTYRLTTNVVANKVGFIAIAPSIILDLNGNNLTYNNLPAPTGLNGEFESDSIGALPANWTTSAASGVRVENNVAYLFGNRILQLAFPGAISATLATGIPGLVTTSGPHGLTTGDYVLLSAFSATPSVSQDFYPTTVLSSTQFTIGQTVTSVSDANGFAAKALSIQSGPISIPQSGYSYRGYVARSQVGGTQNSPPFVFKNYILDNSNNILSSGTLAGEYTGISAYVDFTPTNTQSVRMNIKYGATSASSGIFYIDAARLRTSYDYGILAGGSFSLAGNSNLPAQFRQGAVSGYNNCTSFSLICSSGTGSIIQGSGQGYGAHAVMSANLRNHLLVSGVKIYINGEDTVAIVAEASEGTLTTPTRSIVNTQIYYASGCDVLSRYAIWTCINLSSSRKNVIIDNCMMSGFPQAGIDITGAGSQSGNRHIISNNTFYPNSVTTNAYSIILTAIDNVDIFGNTVLAPSGKSGRGFTLDAYSNGSITGINIYNNYVDVFEKPGREYGPATATRALRIRNNASGYGTLKDIKVYNNTFIARTMSGTNYDAFGCRISLRNDLGGMSGCNIILYNNNFGAFNYTTDSSHQAQAMVLDGSDRTIFPILYNNTFESNDVGLRVVDSDGGDTRDVLILDNLIKKTDIGGVALSFKSLYFGYYLNQASNIQVINTRYSDNISSGEKLLYWSGSSTFAGGNWPYRQFFTGHGLDVIVKDQFGNNLNGASVTITNPSGQVLTASTNSLGRTNYHNNPLLPNSFPVITYSYRQGDPINQQTSASINGFTGSTSTPITLNDLSSISINASKAGYSSYSGNYSLISSGLLQITLNRNVTQFVAVGNLILGY